MSDEKPKYEHDCVECKFLGRHAGYDLYIYPQEPRDSTSYIARYGSNGPDYLCTIETILKRGRHAHVVLKEAYRRAKEKGLAS